MLFDLPDLPPVFRAGTGTELGLSRLQRDSAVAAGLLANPRHGWYVVPTRLGAAEEWERRRAGHLDRVTLELTRRPGHVASHTSAALLHGLAITVHPDSPVELTAVERAPRSRQLDGLVLHHSETLHDSTTQVEGLRVTTLDRTIVDVLRTRTPPHALALLDDALRRGVTTTVAIDELLSRQTGWRGAPRARAVLALADPARESWAESFSIGHLYLRSIPLPLHQVEVYDEARHFLGRVDDLWPGSGLAGECDGVGKYLIPRPGEAHQEETVLRHLAEESTRQGGMEALGLRFVRWTPQEIRDDTDAVAQRVRHGLRQPCLFRGWIKHRGEFRRLPFEASIPVPPLEMLSIRRVRRRGAA